MIAKATTRKRRAGSPRQRPCADARAARTPTRATAPPGPTCRTRRSGSTSTGSTRAASRRRFIVHWPRGIKEKGGLRHDPGHLPDIMATIVDVTGATYPERIQRQRHPAAAKAKAWCRRSLSAYGGRGPLFWEHEGNAAVRIGKWKLVRKYPRAVGTLRHGGRPHRDARPRRAASGSGRATWREQYDAWAKRCGVIPREKILELMKAEGGTAFWEEEEAEIAGSGEPGNGARCASLKSDMTEG